MLYLWSGLPVLVLLILKGGKHEAGEEMTGGASAQGRTRANLFHRYSTVLNVPVNR